MTSRAADPHAPAESGAFAPGGGTSAWDVEAVRAQFPMTSEQVRGHPLAYLDSAATALKPRAVIAAVTRYYQSLSANVARGVHTTSQRATEEFEAVRHAVARFLGVDQDEVVFTGGTTASLNLVAQSYARSVLRPGDEILVSEMEHHSNLVPWQIVAEQTGARIRGIPISDRGELDLDWLRRSRTDRTRIIAVCHVSNVLGTIVPVAEVAALAGEIGATLVVDGAQAVPHLPVDVRETGADFYAFSGHKLFGPTGVGVLYGKRHLLERMPPWLGGGGMISQVSIERSTWAPVPAKFEAGTPPIAEVLGLGAAIAVVDEWDRAAAGRYEDGLVEAAREQLATIEGVTIHGNAGHRTGLVTFSVAGVHPHDVGTALDSIGVAVRAGHHCAQPLMARLGVTATVRASFAPYNTRAEVDALVRGVVEAKRVFGT
ncbi:MAG: aminotransferase class V-fold PLP-dependent enzyme [Gemmatimonadales bacterium]